MDAPQPRYERARSHRGDGVTPELHLVAEDLLENLADLPGPPPVGNDKKWERSSPPRRRMPGEHIIAAKRASSRAAGLAPD